MRSRLYLARFGVLWVVLMLFASSCGPGKKASDAVQVGLATELNGVVEDLGLSGVVLVSKGEEVIYEKASGYAEIWRAKSITLESQFVIGSISKQITAVLVLRAYEQGLLALDATITNYLPSLNASWADSVTVHHLLSHTHGIIALEGPLDFEPGTRFQYSQFGYDLLSQVLESVTNQSFQELSQELFEQYGLVYTFHPDSKGYRQLVNGYEAQSDESLTHAENSLQNYAAAGSFISNASDLAKWNRLLFGGALLQEQSLELMTQKHAEREHPVFGIVSYGYGVFFKEGEETLQIGALGYAPGFVSTCFYYPKNDMSLVVLENQAEDLFDFQQTFQLHTTLMGLVKGLSSENK